jgi:hypothetical protein
MLAVQGPGEFLLAGVVEGFGQELLGLGDEAGQGVQSDGGIAEPAGCALPGEAAGRFGEGLQAVVAGRGRAIWPRRAGRSGRRFMTRPGRSGRR